MDLPVLEDLSLISGCWHFDPLWVLNREPFQRHPLRTGLRETNCVDKFPWAAKNLYFYGDLRGVKWIYKTTKGEQSIIKYKPEMLPAGPYFASPEEKVTAAGRRRWVLAPIWEC